MIIFFLRCVTLTEPNKLDRDSDTQPNRNQHVHYLKHFESKERKNFAIVERFVVVSLARATFVIFLATLCKQNLLQFQIIVWDIKV